MRKIIFFLLTSYTILCLYTIVHTSGTCDEIAHHIGTGYSYWLTGSFRLNPATPPLIRMIMSIPFLFLKPHLPLQSLYWKGFDTPRFNREFFFYSGNDPQMLLVCSRVMILLLGIFLGILIYNWTRNLYGKREALWALFLYSFSPNIIAHSSLATADIGFCLFSCLSLFFFLRFLHKPYCKNLLLNGLFLGLAQLSKYTATMLYPLYLILTVLFCITNKKKLFSFLLKLSVVFVVSLFVIWAGYLFETKPFLKDVFQPQEKLLFVKNFCKKALPFSLYNKLDPYIDKILTQIPLPLTTYITGLAGVCRHVREGHNNFFMGKWSSKGFKLYFIVAFLIKTPLPVLIFLVLFLLDVLRTKKITFAEFSFILIIIVTFVSGSLSNLQIGLRHILIVYPFIFILCARGINNIIKFRNSVLIKVFFIGIGVWYIYSSVSIVPHSLSYFNEIIGGPKNGYKFLRDSNIDWGQDLPSLSKVLRKMKVKKVKLLYFGEDLPQRYGIMYEPLSKEEFIHPQKGQYYAISVQYMDGVKWIKYKKPVERAGFSILIYKG